MGEICEHVIAGTTRAKQYYLAGLGQGGCGFYGLFEGFDLE